MNGDPGRDHVGRRIGTLWLAALQRRTLRLTCRACPHVGVLDAVPLCWRFHQRGWNQALSDVPGRLYCSDCWTRDARRIRNPRLDVTREPVPSGDLPYPDERVWRRMVARYRS